MLGRGSFSQAGPNIGSTSPCRPSALPEPLADSPTLHPSLVQSNQNTIEGPPLSGSPHGPSILPPSSTSSSSHHSPRLVLSVFQDDQPPSSISPPVLPPPSAGFSIHRSTQLLASLGHTGQATQAVNAGPPSSTLPDEQTLPDPPLVDVPPFPSNPPWHNFNDLPPSSSPIPNPGTSAPVTTEIAADWGELDRLINQSQSSLMGEMGFQPTVGPSSRPCKQNHHICHTM